MTESIHPKRDLQRPRLLSAQFDLVVAAVLG